LVADAERPEDFSKDSMVEGEVGGVENGGVETAD
jgi:hypothetical protein